MDLSGKADKSSASSEHDRLVVDIFSFGGDVRHSTSKSVEDVSWQHIWKGPLGGTGTLPDCVYFRFGTAIISCTHRYALIR